MISTHKNVRLGPRASGFGGRTHHPLVRFRGPHGGGFCGKLFQVISRFAIIKIKRPGRYVEAGILLEQLNLLGRSLVRGRAFRFARGIANFFGKLFNLLLQRCRNVLLLLLVPFRIEHFCLRFDRGSPLSIFVRVKRNYTLARMTPLFPVERGVKNRSQFIVVALRNRIVPMVVALSATHRQAEQ